MEDKLENTIMGKIKTGQVKLRSKYVFLAEKLGLGTAFALSVVLSILFFNLIFFYMKETDNLKYLSFGKEGILAFLESFPYLLVIAFIVLIVLSGYLMTKSDASYKKPFGYLAICLIFFIMVFGGILTYAKLGERIELEARKGHPIGMIFRPLMQNDVDMRDRGIAGVVFEIGDDYLIIQTPQGLRNIDLRNVEDVPEVVKGQFVIGVGDRNGFDFTAKEIKIVNREDMPSTNRGIDFKFQSLGSPELDENNVKFLPPQLFYFDKSEQDCIKNCFESNAGPQECFSACRK